MKTTLKIKGVAVEITAKSKKYYKDDDLN